ncbi:MAG TPA: hydroxymethylglutaryl-CoA lyase [Planctomycetota bacterium]|jgi:hydroxymethylglutaryl-CoA lyase|nr:hydroxymethylglutaryl-CoA lyase [Planctomycetota bacterium]MDP6128019.1 hydroxymethylglutaryl-CoA lyase [Planctomycetota bacterium]HJM39850.1 hydroxymethylglutaryl-CoA lyase [Planctomycetota bacterium]|tara:strand:+ start:56165 stop:57055 length:891 start_codon:yes stop_codon:yes gene_type:complete
MASKVFFHEVAPRDGLQNEATVLGTQEKLELIRLLLEAKPDSIEVTSFVNPSKLPQLADAQQLIEGLPPAGSTEYFALVPNRRGFERLLESKLSGATLLVSATEEHSQANVGMSRSQALLENCTLIQESCAAGVLVRPYVSMAFGCPLGGEVPALVVQETVSAFAQAGAPFVVLADTWGHATPQQVEQLLNSVSSVLPMEQIGLHMHDTHGDALANCEKAAEMGVRHFDTSAGGCGGCPFAPNSAGNLDTHSLALRLTELGYESTLELDALDRATHFLRGALADSLQSDKAPHSHD